jgi:hypothetical protein
VDAFITGSRAYGSPSPESDIDLVLRVDSYMTKRLLERYSDDQREYRGIKQIRFGRLNLIIPDDDAEMSMWKFGTQHLRHSGSPHDKRQAKKILDGLRQAIGIDDSYEGGF